jgi:hypothetical protein
MTCPKIYKWYFPVSFFSFSRMSLVAFAGGLLMLASGCTKKEPDDSQLRQKLMIDFDFQVDGKPLKTDTMCYINAAGNHYLVNEIQFFISDVVLYHHDGSRIMIDDWKDIHYVDSDLPETHLWDVFDPIPAGQYDSVGFTFGICEAKNQSLMFLNPPESYMFWPEYLGGGYHYMKLNGKWLDTNQFVRPFDFHLGIGQIYYSYPDSIIGFVQNYFPVHLPASAFTMDAGDTVHLGLTMNIEQWFENPNPYDHNQWGGDIMQNQDAMKLGCENGWNVFQLKMDN